MSPNLCSIRRDWPDGNGMLRSKLWVTCCCALPPGRPAGAASEIAGSTAASKIIPTTLTANFETFTLFLPKNLFERLLLFLIEGKQLISQIRICVISLQIRAAFRNHANAYLRNELLSFYQEKQQT